MTDEEFLAMLTRHEGKVKAVYQDSLGFWTIGVGRLIDKRKGGGLSDDEITYLLKNDVDKVVAELDKQIPWWRNLSENRQAVLANMAFNLGVGGLLKFKNTLGLIRDAKYNQAASAMLQSKWAEQVKGRATELAEMMRVG